MSDEAQRIFDQIKALSPADRLRFAAGALDEAQKAKTYQQAANLLGMVEAICRKEAGDAGEAAAEARRRAR